MLFRLTNTLVSYIRIINKVLETFLDLFYIYYLDDIIIYSKTIEEY